MKISRKLLLSVSLVTLAFAANAAAPRKDEAPLATPQGITLQPLGKAQGYDMGKQTASVLFREQLAFADGKGMTLYTYVKDQPGKSTCVGSCTSSWIPLAAGADAKPFGDWSVIARDDGAKQWAYRKMPLYTFVKDVDPGSIGGNSPARYGSKRIDGAGNVVGGGIRGSGARNAKPDAPLDPDWKPALAFPVAGLTPPDGVDVREVPDANALVLVDYRQHTLYSFDGDVARDHVSDSRWQPIAAPQAAHALGDFGFVVRADGIKQWTYKGKALFTFTSDLAPGDAYGIGTDKKFEAAELARFYMPASASIYNTPGQGKLLATAQGMTLYRRDGFIHQSGGGHNFRRGTPQRPAVGRDIGIAARCVSDCDKWHPFLAPADAKPSGFWNIAARPDGAKQWVYQGYALWTFDGDKKPGDMNGNDSFDFTFAGEPGVPEADAKKVIDLGTAQDGAPALYWAIAVP